MGQTLRAITEKAPYGVIRLSFGTTKLRSSRLVWRLFSDISGDWRVRSPPSKIQHPLRRAQRFFPDILIYVNLVFALL